MSRAPSGLLLCFLSLLLGCATPTARHVIASSETTSTLKPSAASCSGTREEMMMEHRKEAVKRWKEELWQ